MSEQKPLSFNLENPPTLEDLRAKYVELYLRSFPGLDESALYPGTPFGNIIDNDTQRDFQHIEDILIFQNVARGTVIGSDLDAYILNNYGLERKPQTNGTVEVTIYGTPGFVIPQGFEVRGYNTAPYVLLKSTYIPANGKVTVSLTESIFNTVSYPANTITQIVTSSYDIERVTQEKVSVPGKEQENDEDFFSRAIAWGSLSNNSSYLSIMSRVANIPGVLKCNGFENNNHQSITHQGTQFPPHSVGIVVWGGSNEDIARAIYQTKPPGVVLAGDVQVPLLVDTKEITYSFYRPRDVPLKAEIKVVRAHGYPNNYEQDIKNTLISHINSLKINAIVLFSNIVSSLDKIKFNYHYEYIKISKKSETPDTKNINLDFTEMVSISPEDITIQG